MNDPQLWLDVFGWTGSGVLILSLLQKQVLRLRIINAVASVMLVVYNVLIAIWPMVGMNAAVLLIDLYFIWKVARDGKRHASSRSPEGR
ncbi:YgjV family protein [Streptosporangium sp. 'caverna']|uniref:YgjV family protein n=1 Tax=Streptosporangium sp. 'caverna' TaxID=2202249 RepID=UPI000D7E6862|nr:YgjV family protein [Streptosporangium sp. 'caverna']AWS46118.1 hypothetical protein DKM19_37315 [Streptosporangium sp. 'caverna']